MDVKQALISKFYIDSETIDDTVSLKKDSVWALCPSQGCVYHEAENAAKRYLAAELENLCMHVVPPNISI